MLKDFRKFILRGNVVDLAVGIVIGAAFSNVVNALVRDMITPLIGALYGQRDFSKLYFEIRTSRFAYGDLINALTTFLIIALVIFFLVVQPINKLTALARRSKTTEEPTTRKCPFCLEEIAKDAKRCRFCTSKLEPEASKA